LEKDDLTDLTVSKMSDNDGYSETSVNQFLADKLLKTESRIDFSNN